jgi:putative PEP-CTERM system integral membrane protein
MRSTAELRVLFQVLFWNFNLVLLLIAYLGMLPYLGTDFLRDTVAGAIPLDLVLPFIGLVGVPTASALQAGKLMLQNRSLTIVSLFYGIEGPLVLLCLIRFLGLRELTPGSMQLLLTGLVAIGVFFQERLTPSSQNVRWLALLRACCYASMVLIGLYVSTLGLFHAVPVAWWVLGHPQSLLIVLFTPLLLGALFAIALGTIPLGVMFLYDRACRENLKIAATPGGWFKPTSVVAAVLAAWLIVGFTSFQSQPQVRAFALLNQPAPTERDRQELLQKSELIRRGLLNAYLFRYRYLRTQDQDSGIRDAYKHTVGLPDPWAQSVQRLYNQFSIPFTYNGSFNDPEKAAALYAQFFDAPIQRAEQAAIQQAVQSTFNRTEAKAGLLDINQKRVWLAQQEITVRSHGDWGEIELYEVYENQTPEEQEVLYAFSLPESAVLTGVWLGDTANRAQRFPFTVSPRGAAQQVYTQEVKRRVDPALLEQVGPRSYRLRAFPVPSAPGKQLHLWLTYQVMKQEAGWPLPQLSERRNLFWTAATQRRLNGQRFRQAQDVWLPTVIPSVEPWQPIRHQVALPDGSQVVAEPVDSNTAPLASGQHLALILDRSYSMATSRQEVAQTLRWLRDQGTTRRQIDLYLTTAGGQSQRVENWQRLDPQDLVFFGTLQPPEMLQQFQSLQGTRAYDAVVLITDQGSYELAQEQAAVPQMAAPLWLVHLKGLPAAYDDATLEAIQASGGGVATSLQEVIQRRNAQAVASPAVVNIVDGYTWSIASTSTPGASETEFMPLAVRQWVTQLSREQSMSTLANLDEIHRVAQQAQIVTPYSSMIVLVNEQQRQALQKAEAQKDRFHREIEDRQPLPSPVGGLVSGVPEPAEWLLLALSAIALAAIRVREKRKIERETIG